MLSLLVTALAFVPTSSPFLTISSRQPILNIAMQDSPISQNARLREEIEDPFAKVRLFIWPSLFAAAGIATYFAGTGLLAEAAGLRPAAGDTLLNLGVDVGALGGIGFLWRREVASRDTRLRRIQAGAALASLRVQMLAGGQSVKLSELRKRSDGKGGESKRVVVVAAEKEALAASLASARTVSAELAAADLLVVPLLVADGRRVDAPPPEAIVPTGESAAAAHVAVPLAIESWQEVLASELETARSQDTDAARRGLTLILKKNGRVGTRRLGTPDWRGLVDDVEARAERGLDVANI